MENQENERKLTKAEAERAERFAKLSEELESEGYRRQDLTVSSTKANLLGIAEGMAVASPFMIVFMILKGFGTGSPSGIEMLIAAAAFIAGIVVHELLHGLGWVFFTKGKLRSIAFGVVWQALTPYCTCKEALKKGQYILGLVLPLIVLGFIPSIIACVNGSVILLGYGVLLTASAGGDILVLTQILKTKFKGEVLFVDHPTEIGLAAFVKEDTASN